MQIVIDIPEKVVTAIQNGEDYRYDIHTAIAQGIPYEPKAVKRPQGEYISVDKLWAKCSICGNLTRVLKKYNMPNFCPACGADMRKGGAEMDNKDRITELENELKLMKEKLYRLCACLYPQALSKDDLDFIVTGKHKGGAE